jgi:hypothetical protein
MNTFMPAVLSLFYRYIVVQPLFRRVVDITSPLAGAHSIVVKKLASSVNVL